MRLNVTYFDTIAFSQAVGASALPDAGGTYSLAVLDKESPLRLRLMRVTPDTPATSTDERTHYLPQIRPNVPVVLHVPDTWRETYLSIALVKTDRTPVYVVALLATPQPVTSQDELAALINNSYDKLLCFRYVHHARMPSLPLLQPADQKAA